MVSLAPHEKPEAASVPGQVVVTPDIVAATIFHVPTKPTDGQYKFDFFAWQWVESTTTV